MIAGMNPPQVLSYAVVVVGSILFAICLSMWVSTFVQFADAKAAKAQRDCLKAQAHLSEPERRRACYRGAPPAPFGGTVVPGLL